LDQVQELYRIEEKCRKENLPPENRLKVRKAESIPILEKIGKWLTENQQSPEAQIKSSINTAIQYAASRWEGLCAYAHDGRLEIDNNLIENSIRPLALGRKNYLFAGNHDAARNLAALYSIVGTAHKNGLNVYRYLCWLFKKVSTEKITQQAVSWLPCNLSEEERSQMLPEKSLDRCKVKIYASLLLSFMTYLLHQFILKGGVGWVDTMGLLFSYHFLNFYSIVGFNKQEEIIFAVRKNYH